MNADQYYTEIKELTKKRERLLHEAGFDFSLVGTDRCFKGCPNDNEEHIMLTADAPVHPGCFIESRGRKYLVSEVKEHPGALVVKSDAVKAEYPLYETINKNGGTNLKPTGGVLRVFDQSGTSLTVSRAQALSSVGLVVKIGSSFAAIRKATSTPTYHLGKLEVVRIDPSASSIKQKYAEMPDHMKGAPGVLPIRGKAF
jgi:hypothetical protein